MTFFFSVKFIIAFILTLISFFSPLPFEGGWQKMKSWPIVIEHHQSNYVIETVSWKESGLSKFKIILCPQDAIFERALMT